MKPLRTLAPTGALAIALALTAAACGGGGGGSGASGGAPAQAVLTIQDGPADDLATFAMTIDRADLLYAGAPSANVIAGPVTVDLLSLQTLSAILGNQPVPSGTLRGIELSYLQVAATSRAGSAVTVTPSSGTLTILFDRLVPVPAGGTLALHIDIELDRSLSGGPSAFQLDPVAVADVRGDARRLEDTEGTIASADPATRSLTLSTAGGAQVLVQVTSATAVVAGGQVFPDGTDPAAFQALAPGASIEVAGLLSGGALLASLIEVDDPASGPLRLDGTVAGAVVSGVFDLDILRVKRDRLGTFPASASAARIDGSQAAVVFERAAVTPPGPATVASIHPHQRLRVGGAFVAPGSPPSVSATSLVLKTTRLEGTAQGAPDASGRFPMSVTSIERRALSAPLALTIDTEPQTRVTLGRLIAGTPQSITSGAALRVEAFFVSSTEALAADVRIEDAEQELLGAYVPGTATSGAPSTFAFDAPGGPFTVEVLPGTRLRARDPNGGNVSLTEATFIARLQAATSALPLEVEGVPTGPATIQARSVKIEDAITPGQGQALGAVIAGSASAAAGTFAIQGPAGPITVTVAPGAKVRLDDPAGSDTRFFVAPAELFRLVNDPAFVAARAELEGAPGQGGGFLATEVELEAIVAPGFAVQGTPQTPGGSGSGSSGGGGGAETRIRGALVVGSFDAASATLQVFDGGQTVTVDLSAATEFEEEDAAISGAAFLAILADPTVSAAEIDARGALDPGTGALLAERVSIEDVVR